MNFAMTRRLLLRLVLGAGALASCAHALAGPLPERFDPRRDAAADLAEALALAGQSGRRVLVEVGGDWCTWCHILDRFFAKHPELLALRERNYVWLKVNYSKDNKNEPLLSRWPKVTGYPHVFVLDAQGHLLQSQNTGALEAGRDYDPGAVRALLVRFAPPR